MSESVPWITVMQLSVILQWFTDEKSIICIHLLTYVHLSHIIKQQLCLRQVFQNQFQFDIIKWKTVRKPEAVLLHRTDCKRVMCLWACIWCGLCVVLSRRKHWAYWTRRPRHLCRRQTRTRTPLTTSDIDLWLRLRAAAGLLSSSGTRWMGRHCVFHCTFLLCQWHHTMTTHFCRLFLINANVLLCPLCTEEHYMCVTGLSLSPKMVASIFYKARKSLNSHYLRSWSTFLSYVKISSLPTKFSCGWQRLM